MCIFVSRKLRKRINELEAQVLELKIVNENLLGIAKESLAKYYDAETKLAKTPDRGKDGKYTKRK